MDLLFKVIGIFIILLMNLNSSAGQNKAEIKINKGVPSLYLEGRLYPPVAYMSYLGEKEFYKEAAGAGIHLYCFPAYLGDRGINTGSGIGPFRSQVWTGIDQYDFSGIVKDFEKIVQADPQAKIIIRLYLDPPLWWEKMNPEACSQLPDGTTFRQCFSSDKWKEATGKALGDCTKWLLSSEWAEYLIGIHVAAGGTEEWFYHPAQRNDVNPARAEAFRKWLIKKYNGDIAALRNSWQDDNVTFTGALPGNINEPALNRWRDPVKEQKIIDTYRFHSETLVENIEYFCGIVKETSSGTLLTGAFYGYHYYVTDPRMGHGALSKLLECKDLDYLSSPNTYNRVIGEDWPPMVAIKSVQLHGKLWLAENDTRTSITTLLKDRAPGIAPARQYESGVWLGPEDMETSVSFLWKNAGRMLSYGYGGWWFDMWGGWFSDPRLLDVLERSKDMYSSFPQDDGEKMHPEVGIICDEELCFLDASYGPLTEQILSNRYPLGKTGAPYDLYLRTDIKNIPPDKYKVIWLLGFPGITDDESDQVIKWLQKGITVITTNSDGTSINGAGEKVFIKDKISWTDSQLRNVFGNAGVHIYSDAGDVLCAGRNWICIHTVAGGPRTIRLPFMAKITDAVSNKILSRKTDNVRIDINSKSTILLRIDPL